MKNIYTSLSLFFLTSLIGFSQVNIDTLAFQDFETVPAAPVWNYTGIFADLQSGDASPTACIPNSPLGIGSSQAWHVQSVSGGNPIVFNNTSIPAGFDTIRVNFKLAAMNLNGSTGGPDDLDYVLVEYSLDNGATWVNRLRIRGSVANNSFWAYDATGVAEEYYLPATEVTYQPTTVGLQTTEGYSFCEINFPGSISQLAVRITPRSSSASDSWLIDNLVLTGETMCSNTTSSFTATECDSYTAPSGAVYTSSGIITDTISNTTGCDSIMTIDLTINTVDPSATQTDQLTIEANTTGASYQWLDCDNSFSPISGADSVAYSAMNNGNFAVEVSNNGCVDTSSCFTINSVGLEQLIEQNITIFPNPAHDQIIISGIQNVVDFVELEVLTINGQKIATHTSKINQIDVSTLNEGIYIINVVTKNTVTSKRFVKH